MMNFVENYVPFESVSDEELAKAKIFNRCRLAESGCWLWTGALHKHGYGMIGLRGKTRGAHVWSYELFVGHIPEGLHVLHSCDTRACCNPMHLRVGTNTENVADRVARGRSNSTKGALNGLAKLTEADVIYIRNSTSTIKSLADKYGIDRTNVESILKGKTWQHVAMPESPVEKSDGRAKLTAEQVLAIRNADALISLGELSRQYGVGIPLICMIRKGRIWKHVVSQEMVNGC
jgi:hypothetical protein